ncbi:MAG: TonB-dependent receptor [Altererythrobacter sp. XM-24bin4]|jgi:iron complex outermembrane receptor protein|uniref:TonB-dependent receptor plug domain-containing protein n=1 Tax=Altererythrobacter rubellus TaxID=2173831 RepID=A0A9Y2BA18_9SPHN|nr:TonB-dependent receptor [Altererythrobacter rubellus]PWL25064.1 MAG: TonB-dependent receptor [Altererythrobacter sp. XM-24bin4]WIW95692.1 TonB-dependent receptor plug domain-containing protein [Altererythrobacter rubellus]
MNTRFASLKTLALLGAGMAMIPATAFAQDAVEEEEQQTGRTSIADATNVIVVTGTKTQNAENVQDVPLAVTAFNAESLDALKVRDVQGLTYSAPNVSLDQIGTSRGTANFSIRGLGINSSIPSIDPTVGVFVDGVYLGFSGGVVFDLFDLESVEILRGPQGILFGRNTTGGAVLINTGNPTDYLTGKFRAAVDGPLVDGGRGGANYTVSGVISGPIVEDTLLFKLGAYYNKNEGYFTNLFDGSNHGKAETKILRGALEGRFGDLTLTGKLDYFTSDGDGPSGQNRGVFERDTFDLSIDERGNYDNEIWTGSLTAEVDIGPGTLTNIFGYRDYSATTLGDIDSLPIFGFHSSTETEHDQISNEIRYAISTDNFDLTIGGFYFDQSIAYTETRDLPPLSPLTFYGGGSQDHEVLGAFAASQYYLTSDFSVIAGIRWSREEKYAGVTYVRPRPECSVVGGTCPTSGTNPFIPTENNGFEDGRSWTNWSPKFGFQYEFDDSQIYAHWTRGYRSGGYNFRITNATVFETVVVPATGGNFGFDEERVDNYEIGGKFQTSDGALTVNAAVYLTEIDDMQREVNQSSPTAGVSQFILNTADAEILGFEVEGRARVTDNLIFTANLGIIDDDYKSVAFDISSDGAIDDADTALRLPRVPEVTWGVGMLHELILPNGAIVSRVNYQFRDEFAYTDNNLGWIQAADNLDANITWETPMDGLSVSIYGKNLLDQVQAGGDTQLPFGGPLSNGVNRPFDAYPAGGTLSPLSKGRQIGAEMTFEF